MSEEDWYSKEVAEAYFVYYIEWETSLLEFYYLYNCIV